MAYDGKITGISGVVPFPEADVAVQDAALAHIEGYWERIRAGRVVPSRGDVDPKGLEGVLAHAFILERLTSGLARIRIAGSHMTGLLGMEARGLPLSAIFDHDSRGVLGEALEAVFDEPAAVRFRVGSDAGFGRPELTGGSC